MYNEIFLASNNDNDNDRIGALLLSVWADQRAARRQQRWQKLVFGLVFLVVTVSTVLLSVRAISS